MEGPAGEPVLELVLGSTLTLLARLNGKSYRKMLKTVAEHGEENVAVVLQGVLREQGGRLSLEEAGFQVKCQTAQADRLDPRNEPAKSSRP